MISTCAGWIFVMILDGSSTMIGPFATKPICEVAQVQVQAAVTNAANEFEIQPFSFVGTCMPSPGKNCS